MEEGMGSGDRGSDVIKKKSSSGCLIIKKKGNGVSGFGGSSSKKSFESRKEKKRSRLVLSDSGSSDDMVEPIRRKAREDILYERRRSGINVEESRMLGYERKRSGVDVFEFDEFDGFDGKKMRMDYMDDRLKLVGHSGNHRGFDFGSGRNVVFDGREGIHNKRKGSMYGGSSKGPKYSGKSRYEEEDDDDETHVPMSFLQEKRREAPDEPIRLQGKNGVLKVMVNKKKQGFSDKVFNYPRADERISSRSEAAVKKDKVIRPSFYSELKRPDSKRPAKPVLFKTEISNLNSRKALPILSSKAEDSDSDDSEKSLKQESTSEQAQMSKKAIDNERKRTTPTEFSTPPRGKESKVKRGNGTEKQLLREKIRSMLLDRGWKIDYRPRRNRDYLDAVYINPAGTAYWSIIKAYDALQKQLEEEEDNIKPCGESTSFTPLPEEIISKLTRQTRKKIERELKKKKRDAVCSRNAKEVTRREPVNCTDSEQLEEKPSYYRKHNHKSLKGRLHEADHVSGNDSSDSLYQVKAKKDMAEKQSATNSHMIQGRKSRKIGRCTLLVRSSDKGLNSETDGYVPYTGKRTILSWLVDSGIVHMSEKVQYMNGRKTKAMLEGWITKDGIHCGCCSKILTISKFEIHAGSKQRQPFLNIYLESGMSLMQCQIDAWNKQKESEREAFHNVDVDGDDPNDDTCGLCGDGGDLICCDGCPSTFHQSCLDIKMLPAGDWHCPNCTCKFCGFAGWSNAEADDRMDSSHLLCSLCEKKYHHSCSQDEVNLSLNPGDAANSFCGKSCQEIFSHLQKLLGVKHELESGFSWSLVHRMDPASERLHLGFPQQVECNSKLAVALSVMDECFLPIVDRRSGINLIHNVLYNCGSNFSRLNYSAFYTAILEKGDEIISAASIRIHGMQLAEMPFIGTRHIYRRQGMCRRLLSAIESALGTLKVEKLVIPAITEHMHTWTENFNFSPLKKSHKQEMRFMNMLVFPGTDMLQKLLLKREITVGSITNNPGSQSTEAKENSPTLPVLAVSEPDSSPKHDLNMSDSTELLPLTESRNKAGALNSASQILTVPSNDIPAISGSLVSSCELKHELATRETLVINSISVNKLAESTVSLNSTSPSNDHPSTFVTQKAVVGGQSVKGNTQSSVDGVITFEESAKAASVELVGDSLRETSGGSIEEDATVIQNSVCVHDSVSRGTSESTHVESDMSNHTAIDLDDTCEVHIHGTSANPPKDSVEQLCAKDNVEDDTLCETSAVNIEEDAMAIQNSVYKHDNVSRGTSQHIDSDVSNYTAVDLTDTCEVHIDDTSVNPPKDSPDQLSAKDIVEDETFAGTIEEDATAIKNSVSVHDSVYLGACGNTRIDSDMTDLTAVDLDNSCDVNVSDNFVDSPKDSAKQLSLKDIVVDDTLRETCSGTIKEGETAIQNFVYVHNSVSLGACEITHIDSDMTNPTAVDLSYKVNANDTFVNSPKESMEQLSAKDNVEDDTLCETSAGNIEEDATAIPNSVSVHDSVSRGISESTHGESDMSFHTAKDLDDTCKVHIHDTSANPPKDSVEQLCAKDNVEDDTLCENSAVNIEEDAAAIQNSVYVHDYVSRGTSQHIDSDVSNHTAVDLTDSCEVHINDTTVNPLKESADQLSAKDIVEDETLSETFTGPIEEDATAIKNSVSVHHSVSLGACESSHIGSDMTNHTAAVDLDNSCEVDVNDTFVKSPKDSSEQLSATKDIVENDTLSQTFGVTIEEDATDIQNSVSVHNSVSLGTCEIAHVDSDMTDPPAVDLDNSCEFNVNGIFLNSSKESVELLSAKDDVEDDTLCETSAGNIEEDATGLQNSVTVQNSVSHDTFEGTHIDSDTSKHTAVDLDNTCEANFNDTFVNSPEDSVEPLSTENTVGEDFTAIGNLTQNNGGNVGDSAHEAEQKVAYVEPILDPFIKTLPTNNISQAIGEDPSELSSATDVVGDEKEDLKNSMKGDEVVDAQVNLKVASIEPIFDSVCHASVAYNTCQALNENVTGSTSDEGPKM